MPTIRAYLVHRNEEVEPAEERRFPYETVDEARAQAAKDIEEGLPAVAIQDGEGNEILGRKELFNG